MFVIRAIWEVFGVKEIYLIVPGLIGLTFKQNSLGK